jgi:hypothetical protein
LPFLAIGVEYLLRKSKSDENDIAQFDA